jgi:hypothetical protein
MRDETWQEALQLCLDHVDKACKSEKGLDFEDGVLDELRRRAQNKFVKHHESWPRNRELVLLSASFIGKLAAAYAQVKNVTKVNSDIAWHAVEEVKKFCPATGDKPGTVYDWCPSREDVKP